MTVTKHYCDACDTEMEKGGFVSMDAKFIFPNSGGSDMHLTGEFCCYGCAASFVRYGSKPPKVESA